MSGPAPKRQKVDGLSERKARKVLRDFCECKKEDIVGYWSESQNRILDCLRTHPKLFQETFKRGETTNDRTGQTEDVKCFPLDAMIRCGAKLEVIQEIHEELSPQAVKDLMKDESRFLQLEEGFVEGRMAHTGREEWTSCITAEVLEFLVQNFPALARRSKLNPPGRESECSLFEWVVRRHAKSFVRGQTVKTVLEADPEALLRCGKVDPLGYLVQNRCRKPRVIKAIVDAILASNKKVDTVTLTLATTRRELREMDAEIISKLFPFLTKITIPLTYVHPNDNGSITVLEALGATKNSIKELVLEMPSRAGATLPHIKTMSKMIRKLLASENLVVEKLVLKSRHLPSYYGEYPFENWIMEIFQEAEGKLPLSLTFLEFSNIEIETTFNLAPWLRTPNLPATVAFSGLKVEGLETADITVDDSTLPTGPTIKHLEFFAEGDRDTVKDMLEHIGTATHLKSLSMGFSQATDVTGVVRSLMRSTNFEVLELHANTVLNLPAFCEMLRANDGLRKFHKLQYPKDAILKAFEDILESHNTTLRKITMMTTKDQTEKIEFYTTLNRFGRREAHNPSIPLENLVGLLANVREDTRLDRLSRVNTNYGLLRESIIGTWAVAAYEHATEQSEHKPRSAEGVHFWNLGGEHATE